VLLELVRVAAIDMEKKLWEVVGGADHGGILVRVEQELSSAPADGGRLSKGALVRELELQNGRLHYELVHGAGPAIGWVSINLKHKELVVEKKSNDEANGQVQQPTIQENSASTEEEIQALHVYGQKFGAARDGVRACYNRHMLPVTTLQSPEGTDPTEAIQAALVLKSKTPSKKPDSPWHVDSEGEEVPLCARCFMPVGQFAYQSSKWPEMCLHSECMAQVAQQEVQEEDDQRVKEEAALKLESRKQYEIGWRMDSVPKNAAIAERLGCSPGPHGMCCLVYDECSRTVRVATTHEPAAAVNLEYLILALKVRRQWCREPLFSLDPVDPHNLENTMQKKRYEPEWLAGTSVGDVMFQADYLLKEYSMGEYTMPVVGMLSVFDWSEMKDSDPSWCGREWFVVKRAEVRVAQDMTLIPHVKMGVEARETALGKNGLEDKPVTAPTHPLKKFAEAFTRNYDLIAERKSCIFHLRELAKATVLAKFLVDSNAQLESIWYDLGEEIVKATPPETHPEIPQLWNMRGRSRINLKGGRLVDVHTGFTSNLQALYGGVQFGVDKFPVAQQQQQQRPGQGALSMAQAIPPMARTGDQTITRPGTIHLTQHLRQGDPKGVDLNLDSFDLSGPDRFAPVLPGCSAGNDSAEARVSLGKVFLRSFHDGTFPFKSADDHFLLKTVFNPAMGDRTEEGVAFLPPDPNLNYISSLRSLVTAENDTRKKRMKRFCDKAFTKADAGSDFPNSWTSRCLIEHEGKSSSAAADFTLTQIRVDSAFEKTLMKDIIPRAVKDFDKATEEGTRYRIYSLGSFEVRTVQQAGARSPEVVGAVFARRTAGWTPSKYRMQSLPDRELLVQGRVYIEEDQETMDCTTKGKDKCHYYVVLETNRGNIIVTEKLTNGSTSLVVSPDNIEDRNSLARLLFTVEPGRSFVSVHDLKRLVDSYSEPLSKRAAPTQRKAYAKAIYKMMAGRSWTGKWGGGQPGRRFATRASLPAPVTSGKSMPSETNVTRSGAAVLFQRPIGTSRPFR